MSRSLKANLVLNTINTVTKLLFPLITFPYATRILGPQGIGQVSFLSSIINYVVLFSSIGIPMYAIREVARVRNDSTKANITVIEIFVLHSILTMIGYVAVVLLSLFVPEVQSDAPLFYILSLTLLFTAIGCEWFYSGIEDFFYITIRGIVVRILSIFFLFLFVHSKDDLLLYGLYCVIGTIGGNLFNFIRLKKYISIDKSVFKEFKPLRHLKPSLEIFILNIVISVYLQLNTVMLGLYCDAEAVGMYTAATRLMAVILSLANSIGPVIMPRTSNLIAENKISEWKSLAQKVYNYSFAITLPLSIGLFFTSKYALFLLCGQEFTPAIQAAQIVSPIIFIVMFSGFMGTQTLYPLGKVKIIIICTSLGAMSDLVLNFLLIPRYTYNGAAFSYLFAEFVTSFSMFFFAKKIIPINFASKSIVNYCLAGITMGGLLYILSLFDFDAFLGFLILSVCGALIYLGVLFLLKDDFVYTLSSLLNIKNKNISQ